MIKLLNMAKEQCKYCNGWVYFNDSKRCPYCGKKN